MKVIITNVTPYKDNDAIINGFNETGCFSFLAKGILKSNSKNAFLNNPLTYAEIEINDKSKNNHMILKSSTLIMTPMILIGNLHGFAIHMILSEIINKCLLDAEKASLFNDILAALRNLYQNKNPNISCLILLAKIFKKSGYSFEVDSCIKCGSKKDIVGFSFDDGGFVCKNCVKYKKETSFSIDQLLLIRRIFKQENISQEAEDISNRLFNDTLRHFVTFIEDNYGVSLKNCELLYNQ